MSEVWFVTGCSRGLGLSICKAALESWASRRRHRAQQRDLNPPRPTSAMRMPQPTVTRFCDQITQRQLGEEAKAPAGMSLVFQAVVLNLRGTRMLRSDSVGVAMATAPASFSR
jgi:NAD(P)-dependent dehydrogenase (short-subunit alcohol dehydrogenase family)